MRAIRPLIVARRAELMPSGRHAGHTPSVWPQAILFRIAVVRALDRRPRDRGHRRPPPGGLMHPITGDAEPPDTERSPAEISSPQPQATPGRPLSLQRGPLLRLCRAVARGRPKRAGGAPPARHARVCPTRRPLLAQACCAGRRVQRAVAALWAACRSRDLSDLPSPRSARRAVRGPAPAPRPTSRITPAELSAAPSSSSYVSSPGRAQPRSDCYRPAWLSKPTRRPSPALCGDKSAADASGDRDRGPAIRTVRIAGLTGCSR
jgi:hypothetical protein